MEVQKTLGIVLKSIPFKERDQILTLFTPYCGLLKLYARVSRKANRSQTALLSPLTEGEFYFRTTSSELHQFEGGDILCQYASIRENYAALETALKLLDLLGRLCWPGKENPQLYALFSYILKQLPSMKEPQTLFCIFLLKTMCHEGIFQFMQQCSQCNVDLTETYRFGGEIFCKKDAPSASIFLEKEEERTLYFLAHNRSFDVLKDLALPFSLQENIEKMFMQWLENL